MTTKHLGVAAIRLHAIGYSIFGVGCYAPLSGIDYYPYRWKPFRGVTVKSLFTNNS